MLAEARRVPKIKFLLSAGLLLAGVLCLALPVQLAGRAYLLADNPEANIWLIYGLGIGLIGLAIAVASEPDEISAAARPWMLLSVATITVVYYLTLTMHLRDWWIDDAGITFAYSRSLAEGLGLVAQPWLPPEEGYSSLLWMLLLSFSANLGADIPIAAKYIGIICSAACIVLCAGVVFRELRSPLALMVCGLGIACGPTIVWAVSGQEHALQSLILVLVVLSAYTIGNWRWPVSVLLAVFVVTRPEAPIIVIAVFCAVVFLSRREGRPLFNAADAAVAFIPFLVFVGLIAFRVTYFGDPMPNPYYAKASGAGFIGVLNPLGGGWSYIFSGLRDTALLFIVWLIFMLPVKRLPPWIVVATAVLAGHVFFVVWAKGDWMGQYRFLMPILPIVLLVACYSLTGITNIRGRRIFAFAAVMILLHTTALQLAAFKTSPTTPLAEVTRVGDTFRQLADHLSIEDPLLAHHDAGGIAYYRMIRLADLGGLVNRTIAKHMDDEAFLSVYLLEELRPDFFFGARNFATAAGFSNSEAFEREYVRLDFPGLPFMKSDLSYIRRDLVVAASGVQMQYDDNGALTRLRVQQFIFTDKDRGG